MEIRGSNSQSSLAPLLPIIMYPIMSPNLDTLPMPESANHHPEADTRDQLDVRKIVSVLQPTKLEMQWTFNQMNLPHHQLHQLVVINLPHLQLHQLAVTNLPQYQLHQLVVINLSHHQLPQLVVSNLPQCQLQQLDVFNLIHHQLHQLLVINLPQHQLYQLVMVNIPYRQLHQLVVNILQLPQLDTLPNHPLDQPHNIKPIQHGYMQPLHSYAIKLQDILHKP